MNALNKQRATCFAAIKFPGIAEYLLVAIQNGFLDLESARIEAPIVALIVFVAVEPAPRYPFAVHKSPLVNRGEAELERAGRARSDEDAKAFADAEKLVLSRGNDQAVAALRVIAKDFVHADLNAIAVHAELDRRVFLREREAVHVALGLLLEKDGGHGGDCGIACAKVGRAFGERVDGEGREPHGGVFTNRIKDVSCSGGASSGFRNKERVAVTVVAVCPVGEVRGVEVRRVNVDCRTGGFPDINHARLWSATRIIARRCVFTAKPSVHVHWKVVRGFALAGDG